MTWKHATGRVIGATLFVVLFNGVALSVFVVLPPLLGLAWVTLFIVAYVWWHFRRGGDRGARIALVRLRRPRGGAWPVIGVAASLIIASGIAVFIHFMAPELGADDVSPFHAALLSYKESIIGSAALVAALAVLAPLVEESSFRGYVQHTLEDLVGPGLAIGLAAGMFALVHLGASHWSYYLLPLGLGCASGVAVYLFNSIWVGVAIHGLWNLAMTVSAAPEQGTLTERTEPSAWWLLLAFALVGAGIAAWIVVWKRLGSRAPAS